MALDLKCTDFEQNEFIPRKYSCQGEDKSPALHWIDEPLETKSFAIICDDPDAPSGIWVHWLIYNIPAQRHGLPEGTEKKEMLEDGARQGVNDSGDIGYGGPCPPPGRAHRYFFKLYCLDTMLNLKPGFTKDDLLNAMKGHVIEEAQLIGLYKR
ncbi:MAG: YbhB/YbcL family Raf kinase inhibitor-like protein [Candidatus Omnitrophica bacterium]|nr:YbhB/YbcL family Raf kinase inhibitor-like protein [Candidatus Omnitrophota bacterium]MDD5352126.1 YbhB/YbcL family Raf kinase inhibitor-like protein [Candidatus Omnitrophota bacterium]MDD5549724.1 YbhB/YbcL family Raf kinase inhibitor-like protein [Candidatus Omnitrophota bacterium]